MANLGGNLSPLPSPAWLANHQLEAKVRRGEFISFTTRSFDCQLDQLRLTRAHLTGKRVLAVGAGLTDFVAEANRIQGCECFGIDPLYALVGRSESPEELLQGLPMLGMALVLDLSDADLRELFNGMKRELVQHADRYAAERFESFETRGKFDLIVACHVTEYFHPEQLRESLRLARASLSEGGQITIAPFNTYLPTPSSLSITLRRDPSLVGEFLNKRDDGTLLEVLEESTSSGMAAFIGLGQSKPEAYNLDPMEQEVVSHTLLMICNAGSAPCYSPPSYAGEEPFTGINVLRIYPERKMYAGGFPGCAAEPSSFVP